MREFNFEEGENVDLEKLKAPRLPREDYEKVHKGLPIVCHDVVIKYKGGVLMVLRKKHPVKGEYWIIGGRVNRGVPMLKSLKRKVKEECGLDIQNVQDLCTFRTFFSTDPFNHGKGTDTISLVYVAEGNGELKLDDLHEKPLILKKEEYPEFREKLHPCMKYVLDLAMNNL